MEKDLFKDEKGNMLVPHTGEICEKVTEHNYVFDIKPEMFKAVASWQTGRVVPESILNQVSVELKTHKPEISVSRPVSRLQWGIPVPDDSSQTIYVWLDALVNYLTVIGYPASNFQSE